MGWGDFAALRCSIIRVEVCQRCIKQSLLSFPGPLQGNSSTILERYIERRAELIIVNHRVCLLSGSLSGDVWDNKEMIHDGYLLFLDKNIQNCCIFVVKMFLLKPENKNHDFLLLVLLSIANCTHIFSREGAGLVWWIDPNLSIFKSNLRDCLHTSFFNYK